MSERRVLVTGGSGFIGGHVVLALLEKGFRVRTTIRSLEREAALRDTLTAVGMTNGDALEVVAADLMDDAGWPEALDGVDLVAHVASPVMPGHVEDEDAVIVPAREGALRVLAAARAAGVERVVLTSAFHAVAWGHPHDDHVFTESDWTVTDGPGADAYARAKTLAERAAWDAAAEGGPALTTLMPVAVVGPLIGDGGVSGANALVQRLLTGQVPGLVDVRLPIVDVRDVAAAHVAALTAEGAAGERFLLGGDPAIPMRRVAEILRDHLGDAAARVPTQEIPDDAVRAAAETNPAMRATADDLGYARRFDADRARAVLGWSPRSAENAVVAAARSMVEWGLAEQD